MILRRLFLCVCCAPVLAGAQQVWDSDLLIRALPCSDILGDTTFGLVRDTVEMTPESERMATELIDLALNEVLMLRAQAGADLSEESSDASLGNAFYRAWLKINRRELKDSLRFDPPYVGDSYPHDQTMAQLGEKVRRMVGGIRSTAELDAVARVTAALFTATFRAAREGRRHILRTAATLRERADEPESADLIKGVLDDFNARYGRFKIFYEEFSSPVSPRLLARLDDPDARRFLAHGLGVVARLYRVEQRQLARGVSDDQLHYLREQIALRLRNDWKLVMMDDGAVDADALLDVRRQIRSAMPRATFYEREALVADVVASPALRAVLREAADPRNPNPADRELRRKELLYFLAFMHPEFSNLPSAAEALRLEAVRASAPSKQRDSTEVTAAARRAATTGIFQYKAYRRWLLYVHLNDWSRGAVAHRANVNKIK